LDLTDTIRSSRNKDWVFIQATNAKFKRLTACTQLRAVYVISGQTAQSPKACQSKQP
jgi:hypothetical protein